MNSVPSIEDRIWAVISHISSLALGMGIALPIVGWSDQRRKSNYAAFQSLQALGYQSLGFTIWILSYLVIVIVAIAILIAVLASQDGSQENLNAVLRPWLIVIFILLFGFFALYFLLPIIAALACAFGRDFRYPILGDRLALYLGYEPAQASEEQVWLNEDHELRWMAAMGHFSILILLWGMLAPLTAWMLYGRRSFFLKFQSIQTLVYQAAATVLLFLALVMYSFGFFALLARTDGAGQLDLNSSTGLLAILLFGAALLISLLIILFIPLLHILGQWAGYRVLKGDDYHYPLIGRWVERKLLKKVE
ncbi:MAG TPA: DUF4870 domain-containing protein [Anaerolineales bacterium]|nr:DUF4870 domain-containing protein [Anaerolineales bacterium]